MQRHPICLSIDLPTTTPVLLHIIVPLPDCYVMHGGSIPQLYVLDLTVAHHKARALLSVNPYY